MGVDRTVGEGKKRWILSIRTTADGRERLVKAADQSGRSLSEEIETRLQHSFERDDIYGGSANAAFVSVLGSLLREIETETGKSWRRDPSTWRAVREGLLKALDERAPAKTKSLSRANKAPKR